MLAEVVRRIDALEARSGAHASLRLLALVETPSGVLHAASLPHVTSRIEALCFGHADFSREMGLACADASDGVILHARCAIAIAARASGMAPIDTVFLDVRDDAGFRRDAELGLRLGFEGKLCIHPNQVEICNAVHTPGPDQIEYSRRVLEAAREAREAGQGVFTVDGKMVDAPLIAVQERVLERARRAGVVGAAEDIDGG